MSEIARLQLEDIAQHTVQLRLFYYVYQPLTIIQLPYLLLSTLPADFALQTRNK